MGGFSLWHWLIVGIVILLLFGKGRFSSMMGDVAQGLKSFKKGMAEEDEVTPAQRTLTRDPVTGAPVADVPPPVTRTGEADEIRRS
jgi:sec-independent protein translocase protein TatA